MLDFGAPGTDLSVIVPVHNEEESVIPLCEGIIRALEPSAYRFEVLLVDDGSTDCSLDRALYMANGDPRIAVIKLSKNFGQTAALLAGFEHARGRIIVSMDGDLQNDPADIEALVRKVREGNDFVVGRRENRQDRWLSRKIPSILANWLIRRLTGLPIHDIGCGLRAYNRDLITSLPIYSEMHRLLPMIASMAGARIGEIPVRHHPRKFGQSKYGISRVYKVIADFAALRIILSLFRLPLFGFGLFAVPFLFISMIGLVLVAYDFVADPDASLVVPIGVCLLSATLGIFLLMVGILCDLIYRTGRVRVENLLKVEVLSDGVSTSA